MICLTLLKKISDPSFRASYSTFVYYLKSATSFLKKNQDFYRLIFVLYQQNISLAMSSDKVDLYQLAQQDYYVLEEMVQNDPKILKAKDTVSIINTIKNITRNLKISI